MPKKDLLKALSEGLLNSKCIGITLEVVTSLIAAEKRKGDGGDDERLATLFTVQGEIKKLIAKQE